MEKDREVLNSYEDQVDSVLKPRKIFLRRHIGSKNPGLIVSKKYRQRHINAGAVPASFEDNLSIFKKIGAGIKKAVKKVGTVAAKAGKGIAKAAKSVAKVYKSVISFAVLAPLSPIMGAALKKRGVNPPSNLKDRAKLFYNTVVAKNQFESKPINFDQYDGNEDHLVEEVVSAILKFVKGLVTKKKAGEPVPPGLEDIASGAASVIDSATAAAADPKNQVAENSPDAGVTDPMAASVGGLGKDLFKNPMVLAIAAVVVVLVIIMVMKK